MLRQILPFLISTFNVCADCVLEGRVGHVPSHPDIVTSEKLMRRIPLIRIVENVTQRGYENFGAVMDSVAAVTVAVVREKFGS